MNLLSNTRTEVLPLAYHNYDTFTEEKSAIQNISSFFCGLHALVNYAETAQKCIRDVDNQIFDNKPPSFEKVFRIDEPGKCRFIRRATKCFGVGSGGDEKSGFQRDFKTYTTNFQKTKGLKYVPLKSYRGSRFNILFSNACSVFYLHEQMTLYLKSVGTSNGLQRSILFDIQVPEFLAGMKTLGLISKYITCPLWCVLENKSVSITDMNSKYLELVTYIEDVLKNIDQFISGNMILFEEHVQKDCMLDCLLKTREYDGTFQTFICQLVKRLYKDHLPEGRHANLDKNKFRGVPKTSCFAESIFGQLDQLMRTKPNISTFTSESSIMFLNNRTMDWLNSKKEHEKYALIASASKQVKQLRITFKNRIQEIKQQRIYKMQEKIKKKEELERERIRKQTEYTNNIVSHDLWQSESQVESLIKSYKSQTEKINVLKAQLKFRKEVLHQVTEGKATYNISKTVRDKKQDRILVMMS